MRAVLHPEADEELAEAVRYYATIEPELGVRFYREIERLILEVCAEPKRFRRFDHPRVGISATTFHMPSFTSTNLIGS